MITVVVIRIRRKDRFEIVAPLKITGYLSQDPPSPCRGLPFAGTTKTKTSLIVRSNSVGLPVVQNHTVDIYAKPHGVSGECGRVLHIAVGVETTGKYLSHSPIRPEYGVDSVEGQGCPAVHTRSCPLVPVHILDLSYASVEYGYWSTHPLQERADLKAGTSAPEVGEAFTVQITLALLLAGHRRGGKSADQEKKYQFVHVTIYVHYREKFTRKIVSRNSLREKY